MASRPDPAPRRTSTAIRTCVHCGICLPQCPTYRVLGEEMDSPRGRVYLMRAVAEGSVGLTETFARHLDLCLGCRACETACPSGVPFGQLLEATRAQLRRGGPPAEATDASTPSCSRLPAPRPARAVLAALRLYQRSGLAARWSARAACSAASRAWRRWRRSWTTSRRRRRCPRSRPRGDAPGRVGLLTGCVQRHLYPDVNATRSGCCRSPAGRSSCPRAGVLRRAAPARRAAPIPRRARPRARRGLPRGRRLRRDQRGRLRLRAQGIRSLAARRCATPFAPRSATSPRCSPTADLPLGRSTSR